MFDPRLVRSSCIPEGLRDRPGHQMTRREIYLLLLVNDLIAKAILDP